MTNECCCSAAARAGPFSSRVVSAMPELLQWAIVNPRQPETYAQAAALMASPSKQCCGLKIHPDLSGLECQWLDMCVGGKASSAS